MCALPAKLLAGVLTAMCAWGGLAAASAAASPAPRVTQQLAALFAPHAVFASPRTNARVVEWVWPNRPITGEQTKLPVIAQTQGSHGRHWLKVMLPGRPNGSSGWIEGGGTNEVFTGWHIFVKTSARRIWVYFHARLVRTFQAVVGKPSTPTPTGNFFVEETIIMPASMPGGPFALALSARSNVLQEFDGGPGQIGIHGRDGLGGTLGTAESHGCMRLATPDITWLAARIGPGVPVTIDN
jgi:hypothetical protein